jgi:hypothetical protein
MSQVTTGKENAANAGEVISSTKANAIYTEISTASTAIDSSNTRTESISRRHLVDLATSLTGEHPTFHQLMSTAQSAASASYNNTVYADVSHGGGCIINFVVPVVLQPGEVLRLQASINMTESTIGANSGTDYALTNCAYFFAFFGDPGGASTQLSPDFGYSLTSIPGATNIHYLNTVQSYSDKNSFKTIVQQREAFSYIYINKTSAPITFTNVRVKVKVQTPVGAAGVNTIKLKEFRIVALGAR